jgi:hypothetical protein
VDEWRGKNVDRFAFDDVELSYELDGGGERVVLVHASPFVSWHQPLIAQLRDVSTLTYRRHLRKLEAVLSPRSADGSRTGQGVDERSPPPWTPGDLCGKWNAASGCNAT